MKHISDSIYELKKERKAVILAHYYQNPNVQDIADFVGDSLDLSRKAAATDAAVIVFCGVRFMAETAKILSPDKRVLLPEISAGCPMADQVSAEDVLSLRKAHPQAVVVCYVNTTAEVKAVCDICCTSSNVKKVIASLKEEEIIFLPDRNLGRYVSRFFPEKRFFLYQGQCPVHDQITVDDVKKARQLHSDALLLVHPECRPEVIDLADFVGSTRQILDYAAASSNEAFIIGTELGILHPLVSENPNKHFYPLKEDFVCQDMKRTTKEAVEQSLKTLQPEIILDSKLASQALGCLDRMLAL
ncbi:MAG: quinolinate synthase NadA [Clostridia bacterium]|nr:quinolinate synthase NadA [Clostridia bacterium]